MEQNAKVYISGALTAVEDLDELRKFYEAIGDLCRSIGMTPYIPHSATDPVTHPEITPNEVYNKDRKQVVKSALIIAYVGVPSLGVGSEIEIARENDVPVILLYERGKKVSRMARGNPAVIAEIAFNDFDDGLHQLRIVLEEHGFARK